MRCRRSRCSESNAIKHARDRPLESEKRQYSGERFEVTMNQSQTQSQPATARASLVARLLDPVDRLVEAMYSVLIVLTFTLAYRVAETNTALGQQADATEVSQLLVAALGCAVAWGIIDGVMYVATSMFQHGQKHRLIMTIRNAANEQEGDALIADQLDDQLAPIATEQRAHSLVSFLISEAEGRRSTDGRFPAAGFCRCAGHCHRRRSCGAASRVSAVTCQF